MGCSVSFHPFFFGAALLVLVFLFVSLSCALRVYALHMHCNRLNRIAFIAFTLLLVPLEQVVISTVLAASGTFCRIHFPTPFLPRIFFGYDTTSTSIFFPFDWGGRKRDAIQSFHFSARAYRTDSTFKRAAFSSGFHCQE